MDERVRKGIHVVRTVVAIRLAGNQIFSLSNYTESSGSTSE